MIVCLGVLLRAALARSLTRLLLPSDRVVSLPVSASALSRPSSRSIRVKSHRKRSVERKSDGVASSGLAAAAADSALFFPQTRVYLPAHDHRRYPGRLLHLHRHSQPQLARRVMAHSEPPHHLFRTGPRRRHHLCSRISALALLRRSTRGGGKVTRSHAWRQGRGPRVHRPSDFRGDEGGGRARALHGQVPLDRLLPAS